MNTRLSKNLSYLREKSGRNKSWVARELGKTDTSIGKYEAGTATPPVSVIEQYAKLFDTYIGDLVGRDLWLGEGSGSMATDSPSADPHLLREKEALHGMLDSRDQQLARLRKDLLVAAKAMKSDPAAEPHYLAIEEIIRGLEGK